MRRALAFPIAAVLALVTFAACDRGSPTPQAGSAAPASPNSSVPVVAPAAPAPVHEREILAPVTHVDRIYKSMTGPESTSAVTLLEREKPELLWIVGFEAVMVEPDGKTPASQEWMCHSNLDLDPTFHARLFGGTKRLSGRLFTLSQGQYRIDLPQGLGIPVFSHEPIALNTQVLNLNMAKGTKDVRHRVTVRFVRDSETTRPMKALFPAAAYGLKLLQGRDGVFGGDADPMAGHDGHGHGSCLPGQNASQHEFDDGKGRTFTGHWVVKPGHEENHTRVTDIMGLPFDARLHYVAVHLHPFAESLELRDVTAGRTVYLARTKQAAAGVGLDHVDFYSSVEGTPLRKDHEYELVSVYENTSGKDQDSMAVMNLYLEDVEFSPPDLAKAAAETPPPRKPGASTM